MKFTDSHEWINEETNRVGISQHAQEELGEIVYLELPAVGDRIEAGEEIAILESTKAAADIYAPVSGKVVAVNEKLKEDLSLLNHSPEDLGWLFQIAPTDTSQIDSLLDKEAYDQLLLTQ